MGCSWVDRQQAGSYRVHLELIASRLAPTTHGHECSGPPKSVFKADDVIFAQVAAGLDFNDFQRDFAGVAESVLLSKRYVGRLVFVQK